MNGPRLHLIPGFYWPYRVIVSDKRQSRGNKCSNVTHSSLGSVSFNPVWGRTVNNLAREIKHYCISRTSYSLQCTYQAWIIVEWTWVCVTSTTELSWVHPAVFARLTHLLTGYSWFPEAQCMQGGTTFHVHWWSRLCGLPSHGTRQC